MPSSKRRSALPKRASATIASRMRARGSKQLSLVYQRIAQIEEASGNEPLALPALLKAFESDAHNGALAMRVGLLAFALGDREVSSRVFRSVTLMKPPIEGSQDGATGEA